MRKNYLKLGGKRNNQGERELDGWSKKGTKNYGKTETKREVSCKGGRKSVRGERD